MAGGSSKSEAECFGNRNLWHFISGTGVLRPNTLIKATLDRNEKKLFHGLLFYKKPTAPQGDQLKERKLSKQHKEFIEKLSIFLGLDERQSYELFFSYISQDFRGSQKNLQLSLSTERHTHSLMLKVRDFYFSERLYLLQCIHHILTYWGEAEGHPYMDEYAAFMDKLQKDSGLMKMLLSALDEVFDATLPSWDTHGSFMDKRQAMIWAHQNLKEQTELLEILLAYWKDFESSVSVFVKLLEKFKRQGFGRRQDYKHILDDSVERMLTRIGSLEVLVLLQMLDMEGLEKLSEQQSFAEHTLIRDDAEFETVDNAVGLLGSEQSHGPILLAWTVFRQFYLGERDVIKTRKLGNISLKLRVFHFFSELLDREPFCGNTGTASYAHYVIYTVLLGAITVFDEETLARNGSENQAVLYGTVCKLLKKDFIANDIWNRGMDQGLGILFNSALTNFPLEFSTLVKLSTSLASANSDSATKVLELWSELPCYTEYLDRNSASDLKTSRDSNLWHLAKDKMPYTAGDFVIHKGATGQLLTTGRGSVLDIPVIQWRVAYDGWQLLKCEIQELLHQVSRGAGTVSPQQVLRVEEATLFVKAICTACPEAADGLSDIINLLYTVIQRFISFTPPPLDLLAASIECASCVARRHPKQAWHAMKQTGLMPFLTENIDNLEEVLSGQGLSPGNYGAVLARYECAQGRYPLTQAFLNFIHELVEELGTLLGRNGDLRTMLDTYRKSLFLPSDVLSEEKHDAKPLYSKHMENELIPGVMYILREILPVYQKWRYYNFTRKEDIGQKCLDISHRILNFLSVQERHKSGRPHLQDICVYSLLFMEAGRALLEIVATGVEPIEMLLAQQSSLAEGSGEDMIDLVQLAFSVLNRLLLLRPPHLPLSPVEVSLSSQPAGWQSQHIVAIIAEYIYHRTRPLLSKLAMLCLKRLAVVLPMSILASLGNQAEPIRDVYLMRLHSATEDLSLKTGILELLSVCVDTQPGLIEVFLNVQSDQDSGTGTSTLTQNKELAVGKTSCLQTVLDLMSAEKQMTYQCPADLLCACVEFVQALWSGMRETAMSVLRARENFWPNLCKPLFVDIGHVTDLQDLKKGQVLTYRMNTLSYILMVLAQEIYCMDSSKLDVRLKKIMKDVASRKRLQFLSTYIGECIKDQAVRKFDSAQDVADNPTLKLLISWNHFLVVLTKFNIQELQLTDDLKEQMMLDLLTSIKVMFTEDTSPLTHRLSQSCSALFFTLMKNWTSSIKSCQKLVDEVSETLAVSQTSGDMVIPSVQIGLVGVLLTVIQYSRQGTSQTTSLSVQSLRYVLISVCTVLLQNTRELPPPSEIREKSEVKDKSFMNTDHRLKLQMAGCSLVQEVILRIADVNIWLPILQENYILTAVLTSAEVYLQAQEGIQYMQTLFLFLQVVAKSEKGAEALVMSGLVEHTCLPIGYCYQDNTARPAPRQGEKKQHLDPVTWQGVYCLCVDLYATLLQTMKYSFLENALNFIGCHQDRLQQALETTRVLLCEEAFREAEHTCFLVRQLAQFRREWRLHLPKSYNVLLIGAMYMCHTFVSYMIRPKYLQHVLEHQAKEQTPVKRSWEPLLPVSLQHQSSTEDVDNPTSKLVHVQLSMMKTLSEALAALRQFSPNLVQILMDQNMDIGEFEPLLLVGFSTPPVDQATPPTFGTLISCVNVCTRMLNKMDQRANSPQKSDTPSNLQAIPKSLVVFVLENALYLSMSQGMLYLKNPDVAQRDKQLLKRELGTELNSILTSIHRYIRRGSPHSPGNVTLPVTNTVSPRTTSVSPRSASLTRSISQTFASNQDQVIFRLVQEFAKQILR